MNIKQIPSNLIADVRGGVCNCIGYSWCGVGYASSGVGFGGYFYAGTTSHANVCRDLIGNLTGPPISCTAYGSGVRYIGCYPQDEGGTYRFLG